MEQGMGDAGLEGDALAEDVAKIGEADDGSTEVDGGQKKSLGHLGQASWIGAWGDGKDEHDADADAEAGGDTEPHFATEGVIGAEFPPGAAAEEGEEEGVMDDAVRQEGGDENPGEGGDESFAGEEAGADGFGGEEAEEDGGGGGGDCEDEVEGIAVHEVLGIGEVGEESDFYGEGFARRAEED